MLLRISTACDTHCSARVQAMIRMYVGLVHGSGMQRVDAATCSFGWDPGVVLDGDLATPAVKAAFEAARARVCGGAG